GVDLIGDGGEVDHDRALVLEQLRLPDDQITNLVSTIALPPVHESDLGIHRDARLDDLERDWKQAIHVLPDVDLDHLRPGFTHDPAGGFGRGFRPAVDR